MTDFTLSLDEPGGFDVTLIIHHNLIVCRNCRLDGCAPLQPSEAVSHLLRHQRAGHRVRRATIERCAVAAAVLQWREESAGTDFTKQNTVTTLDLDLDDDGYPTESTLEQITNFKAWTRAECVTLLGHISAIWNWPKYFTQEGDEYKLSTGGWSGNESIIEALQGNLMFWMRCWESSRRGGHFVFRLPEE